MLLKKSIQIYRTAVRVEEIMGCRAKGRYLGPPKFFDCQKTGYMQRNCQLNQAVKTTSLEQASVDNSWAKGNSKWGKVDVNIIMNMVPKKGVKLKLLKGWIYLPIYKMMCVWRYNHMFTLARLTLLQVLSRVY